MWLYSGNNLSFIEMSVNGMRLLFSLCMFLSRTNNSRIFSFLRYMTDKLTIIVPVFNEQESLQAFFSEIDKFLSLSPIPSSVLLVNDGSTDESLNIILEKCQAAAEYNCLCLDNNYGLSTALKAGIDHCTTSLVGYIDADLQTHPSDFLSYLSMFPRYDMVNGVRQKRKDNLVKRLSSKLANSYRRLMINDGILDTCCPLKIIKTNYAKKIPFFDGMHRFLPALVQLQGGKVKQLPISHFPRYAGDSKYHLRNRLIGPFFDTLAFRWIRSRSIRYQLTDPQK